MKGKVQGLPTIVPMAAASTFERVASANIAAMTKCSPGKGRNDVHAPQEKPAASE